MENQLPANNQPDVGELELQAPAGWKKQLIQKGRTPGRKDVVFISPAGEEIKNKRQLEQYMKSHPRGPDISEFYWGSGDTPRRSSRLGVKSKAEESPVGESPKKKPRKSSLKKLAEGNNGDPDGEDEMAEEKEVAAEDSKGGIEVDTEATSAGKDGLKDTEQYTIECGAKDLALADGGNVNIMEQNKDKVEDAVVEESDNQEIAGGTSEIKEEGQENQDMAKKTSNVMEEGTQTDSKNSLHPPSSAASSAQRAETVKEALAEVADKNAEDKKGSEMRHELKTCPVGC